jgi:hypothetical protein
MKQILRKVIPLKLWPALIKWRSLLMGVKKYRFQVPIAKCVHYGGFRYGHNEYNPLETYLIDLHNNLQISRARWKFIHFLLHYRPRHMGEALGLDNLSRDYPMWTYPWDIINLENPYNAWCDFPDTCPDILTHFCESGILSLRIDEEFFWGERALYSIASSGYKVGKRNVSRDNSSSYFPIKTFELRKCDDRSAYILLDGNHRVSALSALGYKVVTVEQAATHIAFEKDCGDWYGVKKGFYTREDALSIFNLYFKGNHNYQTTSNPAPIIGPDEWKNLYEYCNS